MRLSVICEPGPQHVNEDACYAASDGDVAWLLAADGAGQRVATKYLNALFLTYGPGVSGAGYAARLTRDTVAAHLDTTPGAALMQANAALCEAVAGVYGKLAPNAMRQHEPHLAAMIDEDPRLFRLALPVCVATLARVDLRARWLTFAHAGDTALYLFMADGAVRELAGGHMSAKHDGAALKIAREQQQASGAAHLADVLGSDAVQAANNYTGIYHNYVDENGDTDPERGIGVINGQPQLADYLRSGEAGLDGVAGVLVCSDGAIWPAPADETPAQREARFGDMARRIRHDGLSAYYAALRGLERADAGRDQYPRFKVHDDFTALYIEGLDDKG